MTALHVIGLPHTSTTADFAWCAYSAKCLKFADMMTAEGYDVVLYAGPENEGACREHVVCTDAELPPNGTIPRFGADEPMFQRFNDRAIAALDKRLEQRDIICLIGGLAQQPIAEAFPAHQVVEFGIGYGGVIPCTHHVFESYAWQATVLGAQTGGDSHAANGRFFDAVIPNYWDVSEFPAGAGDGGYLLYVGRLIERKGVQVAIDTAQAAGLPLVVAGAGDFPLPDWVDYRGVVAPAERAELMGGAVALIAPTLYLEPFGGVNVEARLCGTPAITTDFGAFPELITQGVDGYRCHTLAEFVQAVRDAPSLDRDLIRERAIGRFSLDAVGPQYTRYLERLSTLWDAGFYEMPVTLAA